MISSKKNLNKSLIIDLQLGAALLGVDLEKAREMIEKLVATLPQDLEKIQVAFLEEDFEKLKLLVHYVKSGACYCGTPCLKEAADQLEAALLKNKSKKTIVDAYYKLCDEIQAVCDAVI